MRPFLSYGRQTIEDDDVAAVAAALRNDMLTTGPLVEVYEREFANVTGAGHAVSCNSGTAALHLAMLALDIAPGESVIVPSTTFLATANVVRMVGGDVIFADVDPDSGLMTPDTLRDALRRGVGGRAKAAIPVHLNGQCCNMPALKEIAREHGLSLVEDACHALGAPSVGRAEHSHMACFSTHPVKAITTGEGGMVTTRDQSLATKMRLFRNHGMSRDPESFRNAAMAFDGGVPNPWYYEMNRIGWNYRLPDILCALGLSQIRKLDRLWRARNRIASLYDRLLMPVMPALRPVSRGNEPHGWHLYVVLIDFRAIGMTRARVMSELRAAGIGTQVHYIPVHRQPYFRELCGDLTLPGSVSYYDRCLSLPIFPMMSDEDVSYVAETLAKVVAG
jgi:UDP-4-amino-4,6-dideoxy-N-acetyl-beta-L-altrosamine transaminase